MQRLCSFGLFAGCAIFLNGAWGAYLPLLGPAPLRFQVSPGREATVAMLPPLRRDDPVAVTNAAVTPALAADPSAETPELPGPALPDPEPVAPAARAAVPNAAVEPGYQPPVPGDSPPLITPQMIADYLQRLPAETNAPAFATPGGYFIPPLPPPPSSSATYRSR